jgi:hypothetical protein
MTTLPAWLACFWKPAARSEYSSVQILGIPPGIHLIERFFLNLGLRKGQAHELDCSFTRKILRTSSASAQ